MNILIVKTSSLGDVVHTLPALTDAKKAIPTSNFTWVLEESFAEVPHWHPAVQNVIPIAWRRWRKNLIQAFYSGELPKFLQTLRQKKYDAIIDAQGLIKSAIITKIARGISYGYAKNSSREKFATFFYNTKFTIAKNQHAITRIRQLFFAALYYYLPTTPPNYNINRQTLPCTNEEKYLIFLHGSSRSEKCWQVQKWRELTKLATAHGFIVYLPWGNSAELECSKTIAQTNNMAKVLPKLNLSAIATLLQSAKGAIAVDTGLGHVAAALGTPTISLYTATNPQLIGTIGINTTHLLNLSQLTANTVWQVMAKLLADDQLIQQLPF